MVEQIRNLLAHPQLRGLDIDDPHTTALRRQIIRAGGFLRHIYEEWYAALIRALPGGNAPVLELGSGGGFLSDLLPGLITSEIFYCDYVDITLDGTALPLAASSLRGIVMTNVMHHIPDIRTFFEEAGRCVQPGGVITMIEPWVTPWSQWVYTHLHHEPFDPHATEWRFPTTGPLSGANGALPWIVFQRDCAQFEARFPQWRITQVRPIMPVSYLFSGGVSMRSLLPRQLNNIVRAIEKPFENSGGMFAHVVIQKQRD